MKKKITFILVVLIIMSNMMTTFAYSYKDIGDFSNNNVMRDNRYVIIHNGQTYERDFWC